MWLWRTVGRIGGYLLAIPVWLVARFTIRTRVLVVCKDEILVVQGWLSTGSWLAPGGGIRRGEQPVQAARRELFEETGIHAKATALQPLGRMRQTKGYVYPFEAFVVELQFKPTLALPPTEINAARWVRPEDLDNLRVHQHISLLLSAWQRAR